MKKKTYYVADGVSVINGARVPESRAVKLSAEEARFDLSLGRITSTKPSTKKPPQPEPEEGEG